MLDKLRPSFWVERWRARASSALVFAPAYDPVTTSTAKWISQAPSPLARYWVASRATRDAALQALNGSRKRLLIFVGHGSPRGLLTAARSGRIDEGATIGPEHGYLLDADDVRRTERLHTFAWACFAGGEFGSAHSVASDSCFLGFSKPVSFVFHDLVSEQLWAEIVNQTVSRVLERGQLYPDDAD